MRGRSGQSGTSGRAARLRLGLRRLSSVLMAVAILSRIAMPGWAATVSGDAGPEGHVITICTLAGYQTITVDSDGRRIPSPVPAQPSPHQAHDDCLACCLRLPAAIGAVAAGVMPAATEALPVRFSSPLSPPASIVSHGGDARGPPAS